MLLQNHSFHDFSGIDMDLKKPEFFSKFRKFCFSIQNNTDCFAKIRTVPGSFKVKKFVKDLNIFQLDTKNV